MRFESFPLSRREPVPIDPSDLPSAPSVSNSSRTRSIFAREKDLAICSAEAGPGVAASGPDGLRLLGERGGEGGLLRLCGGLGGFFAGLDGELALLLGLARRILKLRSQPADDPTPLLLRPLVIQLDQPLKDLLIGEIDRPPYACATAASRSS